MDEENTNMPDMEEPEAQEENQEPVDVDTGSGEEESSGGGSSVNPGTSVSVGTGGSSEQIADNVMNQGKNLAENAKGKFMRGQNWVSNKLKQRKENLKDQAKNQAKQQLKKKLKGKVAGKAGKAVAKKVGQGILKAIMASPVGKIILLVILIFVIIAAVQSCMEAAEKSDVQTGNISENSIDDNTTTTNREGLEVPDSFSFSNKIIYTYYQYWSEKSLYVYYDEEDTEIFGGDGRMAGPIQYGSQEHQELSNLFEAKYGAELLDKYEREHYFMLSAESLYVLDHYLNDDLFVWPQQFIQPVAYDLDSFTLTDLADGGDVNVRSIKYVYDEEHESWGKLREDGTVDFTLTQYAAEDAVGTIGRNESKDTIATDLSGFDYIAYLSCKYESGGNPGQTGGDNGNACGKYQFDNRYTLGPFIDWLLANKNGDGIYDAFQPYTGFTSNGEVKSKLKSEAFFNVWESVYAAHPTEFEAAQDEYAKLNFYDPVVSVAARYGIDLNSAGNGVKAAIFSLAVRAGTNASSLAPILSGISEGDSEEDIITTIYDNARSKFNSQKKRWNAEELDALALNNNSLDIYEPSSNEAGSIDWSYKLSGGSSTNTVPATRTSGDGNPTATTNKETMSWPLPIDQGVLTSPFGYRTSPTAGASSNHKGIDIGVDSGTPVYAAQSGTVITASNQPGGAGLYVKIDHGNGWTTTYMHNSELLVQTGDTVSKGERIALSGNTGVSTGPHLHFQIEKDGTPMDPLTFKYDAVPSSITITGSNTILGDGSIFGGAGAWTNEDRQEGYITTEGIWDYGFGSIMKYEKFDEKAVNKGTLTHVRLWDNEKEIRGSDGSVTYGGWTDEVYTEDEAKEKVKEDKDRYVYDDSLFDQKYERNVPERDRQVFVIGDVIVPAGTIKNVIESKLEKTEETFGPQGSAYSDEYESDTQNGKILDEDDATRTGYAKAELEGKVLKYQFLYDTTVEKISTVEDGETVEYWQTLKSNIRLQEIDIWNVKDESFETLKADSEDEDLRDGTKIQDYLDQVDSSGVQKYDTIIPSDEDLIPSDELTTMEEVGIFNSGILAPSSRTNVSEGASVTNPSLLQKTEVEVSEAERTQKFYATGNVWLMVPKYVEVPNMDDITGAEYYYDYFQNYQTYAPTKTVTNSILKDREDQRDRLQDEYPQLYEILRTEEFDPDEMADLAASKLSGGSTGSGGSLTGNTIDVPQDFDQCVTITEYDKWVFDWGVAEGTKQDQISEVWKSQGAKFDNGIAYIDCGGTKRYLVAVVDTFGTVGDCIDIYMEDGYVLPAIIADAKSRGDSNITDYGHKTGNAISVIEMEVESASYKQYGNPGSDQWWPELGQKVTKIVNGGSYLENPDIGATGGGGSTTATNTSSSSSTAKDTEHSFMTYSLTDDQLRQLANVCQQEQGTAKGAAAEASLMANRFELYGSAYGTGETGLLSYVRDSGWFANAGSVMDNGPSNGELSDDILNAVKNVLVGGKRTLPAYVDEHDLLSDISSATTNGTAIDVSDRSAYKMHETTINNVYGATYKFYSFPDSNADPFGYTSDANREKFGDVCYDFDTGELIGATETSETVIEDNLYTLFDWATLNWDVLRPNIRNIHPVLKYFTYGDDGTGISFDNIDPEVQTVIQDCMASWPSDMESGRKALIAKAASLIGKGCSYSQGLREPDQAQPKYLDCSGYVSWAYTQIGITDVDAWGFTGTLLSNPVFHEIGESELKPGDIAFNNKSTSGGNSNHTGIYLGKNSSGENVWLHCSTTSSGGSGPQVRTGNGGFQYFFRYQNWDSYSGGSVSDSTFTATATKTDDEEIPVDELTGRFTNENAELKISTKDRLGTAVDETSVLYRMLSMQDGLNVDRYENIDDMFFVENYTNLFAVASGKQFSSGVNLKIYFGNGEDFDSSKIEWEYPLKNAKLKTPYQDFLGVISETGYIDVITVPADTVVAPYNCEVLTKTQSLYLPGVGEPVSSIELRLNESTILELAGFEKNSLLVSSGDELETGESIGILSDDAGAYLRVWLHHGWNVDDPSWLFGLNESEDGTGSGLNDDRFEYSDDSIGMPLYLQGSKGLWPNEPYATSTIAESGCGPSSLAMVLSVLKNEIITTPDLIAVMNTMGEANGSSYWYYCPGAGSYHTIFPRVAEEYGVQCRDNIGNDIATLESELKQGHFIIAGLGSGRIYTGGGHFIVIRRIDENGNIYINDSAGIFDMNTPYTWDDLQPITSARSIYN